MKVKDCIEKPMSFNRDTDMIKICDMPPLEKIIVRIARPYESESHSCIWIGIEAISEYSANSIKYNVRDDCKPKVKVIADFIDKNGGKRLLKVLGMKLS